MNKIQKLCVASVLALGLNQQVHAADYSAVVSGGFSYISSFSNGAVFFYAQAGSSYVFSNFNTSIRLACAGGPLNNPAVQQVAYDRLSIVPSSNDLWLIACVKSSGVSGDSLLGVFHANRGFAVDTAKAGAEVSDADRARATAAFGTMAGQR